MRANEQKVLAALKEDHDRVIADVSRRHEREIRDIKEQLSIEKESWEEMFMRKQQAVLTGKVRGCV